MEKRRLTKILSKTDADIVKMLADDIKNQYGITVVKEPEKALAMIKMRDPVKESQFYIGEVIICEAIVDLDGSKGMAVTMGDNFEKTLNMAVIDAACNKGCFVKYDLLETLEAQQIEKEQKENAMFRQTMVNFTSMDSEVGE